jgi:hypothetical protein
MNSKLAGLQHRQVGWLLAFENARRIHAAGNLGCDIEQSVASREIAANGKCQTDSGIQPGCAGAPLNLRGLLSKNLMTEILGADKFLSARFYLRRQS